MEEWAQKPYSQWEDLPSSLQGIDPKITVAQANLIAEWADAIDPDAVESVWAVAISQFYDTHHVSNAENWVKNKEGALMKELSFEELARRVREAWLLQFASENDAPAVVESRSWPHETFGDHVVIETPEGYMAYPYEMTDDGIKFGKPFKVEDQGWAPPVKSVLFVGDKAMSREEAREAQEKRSKKYGIAVLSEGSNVTMPSRYADQGATDADFGDPTNYKYPVWYTKTTADLTPAQLGQARNAPARFGAFKESYDAGSRDVVEARIERALKKHKIGQYAEGDKTVKALLGDMREKLEVLWKNLFGGEPEPVTDRPETTSRFYPSFKAAEEELWLLVSGSAFLDREGEIISRKALDHAIRIGDETGERGPLRLLHLPGADVGDCVLQIRVDCFLLEAGTWRDTLEAQLAKKTVEEDPETWAASVGFNFAEEFFKNGIYEDMIEIMERSIVRRTKAACPWTTIENVKEVSDLSSREDLVALLQGNEEVADKLLESVQQRSAALKPVLAFKEAADEKKLGERLVALVEGLSAETDLKALQKLVKGKLDAMEKSVELEADEEMEAFKEASPDLWGSVMELEQAELEQLKEVLEVVHEETDDSAKETGVQEVELDQEAMDALASEVAKHLKIEELTGSVAKRLDDVDEAIGTLAQRLEGELNEVVEKQLGELPRNRFRMIYRASQDPDNVDKEKSAEVEKDEGGFVSPFKERLPDLYEATTSKRAD